MPFTQSGSGPSAAFDTYNDINQAIIAPHGNVNVQNNIAISRDSNGHSELKRGMIRHIQNTGEYTTDTVYLELKNILNPSIFTGDHRPECLENTRNKTLEYIYDWANAKGRPNVLSLIGAAGTGKSTIATTVAGVYQKKGQLGCHIFFIRERSHPGNVLQTIAYLLAEYSQPIAESLSEQLKKSGNLDSSNVKTKFDILLQQPLSAVAAKVAHPVLIVLDALDECGTPELRQSLLDVLRDCLTTLPDNFRVLITSRPDEDIDILIDSPNLRVKILDQHSNESKDNVSTYIKFQFNQMKSSGKLKIPSGCDWDDSINKLVQGADGLFIWASTAIKFVREEKWTRYRCFQNLVSNANSLKLDELYKTVLFHALKWDEGDKETFKSIFSLIFFAKHPLCDKEINEILDVEMDVTSNLLSYFRSLVRYEEGQPIRIHHTSFYDYLISCEGSAWHIDVEVERANIASRCLERMSDSLKYNICNLQSGLLNSNVPNLDNRVAQCIPPSLEYICYNWAHHLRDVSYSQGLCTQLRLFVYNQSLFWFEALSLTNTFDNNVGPALQFAIDWVGNNDTELSSFLRDAYRQASIYSEPISMSALQVYNSLLPLTKEDSLMSIHYAKYASTGYRVEYIGRKRRSDCIKTIQVDREREREWEREWDREWGREREWEWRRDRKRRWRTSSLSFLLFSPDGTRILSDPVRVVCIWEATSGKFIAGLLTGDDKSDALTATYSPDGRYIIVASDDGIIRKWDAFTNCPVWEREIDREQIDLSQVVSAAFSPDAKSIVFGNNQRTIIVFNVDTGEQSGEPLEGHTDSVRCLSFSYDGQYFASGSDDETINIWDVDRRKVKISTLKKHTKAVTAVNFSPSGKNVISGSKDRTILVWDVFTGEVSREIECKGEVNSVTYSPNGLYILAGGWQWIYMWNVDDVKAPPKVFQVDKSILRVAFSPDSNRFVSVDDGRDEIQIWDASWGEEETKPTFEEQEAIWSMALSPSGEFIASGSSYGSIYLWNVRNGGLVKKLKLRRHVNSVSFSTVNEKLIAFGTQDGIGTGTGTGTVEVWDVTNEEPVTIGNHKQPVECVAFSLPDGNHVASGSYDNTICIWNVKSRELAVGPLIGHEDWVWAVAYSPDGTRLASGSYDRTVRIWNSETGQLLSTLDGHSSSVCSVAYSFDGSRIVSGSNDKTIRVWNAESGEIIGEPITGHDSYVKSVCFSPDGKRILSGYSDNIARVWDAVTGKPLFPPFSGHTYWIHSVCFFPDGTRFATGSLDGTIRIWTLDEIANEINWELRDDGWVVGENGELMMWIPTDLRDRVCRHRNISMLNRSFYVKLNFGTEQNISRNIQV
ncbi:nucleotide-binding-oligomerization-domain like receptor [Pyrrhoderma noxium]|uniref:Nucleotide-binding-oligomerization-domain like receptor n=1 Tax=Pyrrhoderma noxium TaxID=2282107 RepID=A0A286U540_9AGAM|nr:nucleotide-binding-oligomerization-domain like receptor [Pyrrhoderma noxium]